jgi:hypothetical protein
MPLSQQATTSESGGEEWGRDGVGDRA